MDSIINHYISKSFDSSGSTKYNHGKMDAYKKTMNTLRLSPTFYIIKHVHRSLGIDTLPQAKVCACLSYRHLFNARQRTVKAVKKREQSIQLSHINTSDLLHLRVTIKSVKVPPNDLETLIKFSAR